MAILVYLRANYCSLPQKLLFQKNLERMEKFWLYSCPHASSKTKETFICSSQDSGFTPLAEKKKKFLVASNWKQPKYLSTEQWIHTLVYSSDEILLSSENEQTTHKYNNMNGSYMHVKQMNLDGKEWVHIVSLMWSSKS